MYMNKKKISMRGPHLRKKKVTSEKNAVKLKIHSIGSYNF